MNNSQILHRTPTLDMSIALVPTILVYLLEPLVHGFVIPGPVTYGAATLVIVMGALAARDAIVEWPHGASAPGSLAPVSGDEEQRCVLRQIAKEVSGELKQVRLFNKIVRDELKSVIDMTDSAASDLAEQLLALDVAAAKLGHEMPDQPIKIRRCIDRLVDLLIDTRAQIELHDASRQQIENVIQALRQLDDHAAMLANRLQTWEKADASCKPFVAEQAKRLHRSHVPKQRRTIGKTTPDPGEGTQLLPRMPRPRNEIA